MIRRTQTVAICLLGLAWASLVATAAPGQLPDVFERVGFDQKLEAQVPLDLEFRDQTGQTVRLERYFGQRPVVLCPVYFECPMLCTLELNGLVRSLGTLDLTAGRDFTLLAVSFDPGETPELAAAKRRVYLAQYARGGAEQGWHFLTGDQPDIDRLCDSVGFRYLYDEQRDEYAHASGIVLLTPDGHVARYFYGIDFAPRDLRLGLIETSRGRIGTATDQLLLMCYGYDPTTGRYGLLVMNVIRMGGIATVACLGGYMGVMLLRERRKRQLRDDLPRNASQDEER